MAEEARSAVREVRGARDGSDAWGFVVSHFLHR